MSLGATVTVVSVDVGITPNATCRLVRVVVVRFLLVRRIFDKSITRAVVGSHALHVAERMPARSAACAKDFETLCSGETFNKPSPPEVADPPAGRQHSSARV